MTDRTTKQQCVLLDADVIIKAHEVDSWQHLMQRYDLAVPSTVVKNEVRYFRSKHNRTYKIDITAFVNQGAIRELTATVDEIATLESVFANWFLDKLDPGEIEALALMKAGKLEEAYFCTGDGAAIEAVAMIDMAHRAVSMETLLKKIGITKSLERWFNDDRFQNRISQGQQNRIRGYGLAIVQ